MSENMALLLLVVYIVLIISLYVLFFYKQRNGFMKFVKYVLLPLTAIGGWIVYFIGYQYGKEAGSGLQNIIAHSLQAVFSTGRLFILGNDLVEVPHCMKENTAYLIWFSFIGATAVFISMSILLNVFGKRIITKGQIFMSHADENYIFFSINQTSLSLAEDLLKNKPKRLVIFIRNLNINEDASLYSKVEGMGALIINSQSMIDILHLEKEESIFHIHNDHSKQNNLSKLKLFKIIKKRASHLFFLSDKEEWNISMALAVIEELKILSIQQSVNFHISTNNVDLEEVIYENFPKLSSNIQIKLLNYSDIAARQLIAKHNPVDWIEKDINKAISKADLNVFIIGFGQTGNAVFRKFIECGQFLGSQFSATILDKTMHTKKGRFENRFPGIIKNYSVNFIGCEVGSTDYFNLITQKMNQQDYIIISLGDDELNIHTAFEIQQYILKSSIKKIKILVQVKNNDNYKYLISPSKQVTVEIFGRIHDIFTEDIVVRGKLEKMAKKIHEYYNSKKPVFNRKSWEELSKTEQSSNISEAEHIYIKMTIAGLKTEKIKQFENADEFKDYLGIERMDNLAKGEHLCWNAVLFANGWDQWKLNEIPAESKSHKDEIKKLHACLVSWEELKMVGERFDENYYQYDYESITDIYKLIKEGIYTKEII